MAATATAAASENGVGHIHEAVLLLERNGVTEHRFNPRLDLSKIDRKLSLSNQARPLIGGIDEDKILMMAEAEEQQPGRLPPVLVKRMKNGKYKVLDGNHRVEVMRLLGRNTVAAVVVDEENLTPQQEAMIIYTANIGQGSETTLRDRITHAVNLIEQFGVTAVEASRSLWIPANRITTQLALIKAMSRFETLGMQGPRKRLPESSIKRLGSIRGDDILREAAKLCDEAKVGTEDVSTLVKKLNACRSEKQQFAVLEEARTAYARDAAHAVVGKLSAPKAFASTRATVARVLHVDLDELREALEKVSPEQRTDLRQRAAQAAEHLRVIAGITL
jgi:ParB-like chromosome segregation protein Spo0J